MKKPMLTIMVGLPRIGKSTWIEKNKNDSIVVSPDDIRKELFGHQYHSPANKFIFAITEAMALLLLKQNKNVIIDATNLTEKTRNQWYPIVKDTNAIARVVWAYADKDIFKNSEIAIERSIKSPEGKKIPAEVIQSMAASFEIPEGKWYSILEVTTK